MTRLHEPKRGIPHDEFVRGKRRQRRLDRSVGLTVLVRWPGWIGPVLLLAPFPIVAVLGALAFGSIEGALVAPGLLAALLVLGTGYAVVREGVARFVRRRRGRPEIEDDGIDDDGSFEGPKPQLLLLLVVVGLFAILLGTLLTGGTLPAAVGSMVSIPLLISSSWGAVVVHLRVSRRIRRQRRAG